MKFITESDVRDLYKIQPFTDYDLKEGERLTPGARQFLLDRGIDMYDRKDPYAEIGVFWQDTKQKAAKGYRSPADRWLCAKLKGAQMQFLLTAKDMLATDASIAQQLMGLSKHLASVASSVQEGCELAELTCSPCSGINESNFSEEAGDCFEITDFHAQLDKGREILELAQLRCQLESLVIEIESSAQNADIANTVKGRIYQVINRLSQMICGASGGKECQRNA